MRKVIYLWVSAALMLTLTACGSSGGGSTAASTGTTSLTGAVVSGVAQKGPYAIGSTVEAFELIAGVRGSTPIGTATVTDGLGTYSLTFTQTTTNPIEIVVTGFYLDETTGLQSTSSQPTSVVIADAASAPAKLSINPIASVQAEIVKTKLVAAAAAPAGTTVDVAAEISSAGNLALQAFGIPTTDAAGNAVDPAQIDMLDPQGDPAVVAAVITASAVAAQLAKDGTTVSELAKAVAKDAVAGNPIGTSLTGGTATLTAAATTVGNTDILGNLSKGVKTITGSTTPPVIAAKPADIVTAKTAAVTVATLKGIAISSVSVGGVRASIGVNGTFPAITGVSASNVNLQLVLQDFGTGTGPKARTISTIASFDFVEVGGSRTFNGSINPVVVTVTAAGDIALDVPTNAKFSFKATNSRGTAISGSPLTNVKANNIFTSSPTSIFSNLININVTQLLSTIASKAGNTGLNILSQVGTFDVAFGIDANIGLPDTLPGRLIPSGISSLLPANNAKVVGRVISGRVTTQ